MELLLDTTVFISWSRGDERVRPAWIDISAVDADLAGSIEWGHRDPFDRMIAAQSIGRQLVLVTSDEVLKTAPGIRTL
jgi:PIN domain nuclease of toxin-antitoxin system